MCIVNCPLSIIKLCVVRSELKIEHWLLAVGCWLLVACGSSRSSVAESSTAAEPAVMSARDQLSESDRRRLEYFYLEAAKQKLLGNHVEAYDLYQHCLDICPDASEALYDMGVYRLMLREDSLALRLFTRAAELDPKNTQYKQTLANYHLERDHNEEALRHLEDLAQLQPRRTDVLSQLVHLYSTLNRPADAIRALDRIEVLEGKLASVSYQKYAFYMKLNQEKKAFAELESLCKEYPHELSYRLAIGNQLLNADRIDEARKVFEQVRKRDPDYLGLKLSMLELYRKTDEDSLFTAMRDSLLFAESTDGQVRTSLLRDYISDEMRGDSLGGKRVEAMFAQMDERFPKDLDLLQLRAAYLATYDRSNDSAFVAVMDRVFNLEPENTQALFYLIQYYGQHQDFEHLEDICRRGVLTHPDELVCHYYLGIACYQQDKHAEALQAFQEGIIHKTADSKPAMVADLYAISGDLLHEMKREREAYAAYDSCLTYQADNVGCLNNYAYFLSLRNDQLDKAEEMSYRAIRLEPDNKTYLDTYAWILFMKERYAEAQIYIDRVCPPDSADSVLLADKEVAGVVLEHAGDIAALNGNMEQALRFWILAQQSGGKDLTAVLPRKIKLKKYIKQ